MASTETSEHTGRDRLQLAIVGMTCAACAARIERRLNQLDGVSAAVNLAANSASVELDPAVAEPGLVVAAVEELGYGAHLPGPAPGAAAAARPGAPAGERHDHDGELLEAARHRLAISALLGVPVILLSMAPALQFENWQWLALTLASPVVLWGGWPMHVAAWRNLRHRATTMDTLISLGTLAAFGWSVYALFWGHAGMPGMEKEFTLRLARGEGAGAIYLEVAAGIIVFLLAGRYLEARAKRRAGEAIEALLSLGAKEACVLGPDGRERQVPVHDLAVGDRFVVRPGEKVATDGVVEQGDSAIDASLLTGESVPVEVGPGDAVAGATINAGGRLVVRATRVGADTQLAQMARMVEEAQSGKAPIQRLADRVSAVFVPFVVALAAATFAGWLLTGHALVEGLTAAVAVLIISCPCALGLATPIALRAGTGRGAQLGIIIKGLEVLESTRRVDTIVLDKTGTVTEGRMELVEIATAAGVGDDEALRLVGALEAASEHPVGRAIASAAQRRLGRLPAVESFAARPGLGVQGVVEGRAIIAGRAGWLDEQVAGGLPIELAAAWASAEQAGRTAVAGAWDGGAKALFVVADVVKPTSARAVRQLRALGLTPMLLTGDNAATAAAVAGQVGIDADKVLAEVQPADKVAAVRALQEQGRVVAMVGDGVNDAAALAQADLGIAMGTGTDVAIEASDLTLVRGDLQAAADSIGLSRRTLRTVKGNLFWAFAYNVTALPLAALGFLNPLIAGAAMVMSSLFVVTNSLRLRRFRGAA